MSLLLVGYTFTLRLLSLPCQPTTGPHEQNQALAVATVTNGNEIELLNHLSWMPSCRACYHLQGHPGPGLACEMAM